MFKLKKLNDIIEFNPSESIAAGSIAKKVAMDRLTPYRRDITGYELSPYISGSKFRNGDTLLAKITPCLENGKTAFVDVLNDNEVGFGSTEFIVLRPRHDQGNEEDSIDPDFLYYLSVSPAFRQRAISCMEGTSGRKRVNEYTLKNHSLYIPENKEQRQIAAILSNIDKKIRLNALINHNLEAMAKQLYDYWFVQFDFPDENGRPYKSSGGKMVWNEKLKREIPEGWIVTSLGKLVSSNRGISYNTQSISGSGIPMINLASFNVNGSYKHSGIKSFNGDYSKDKILKPFDLVMCNTQQTAIDFAKDIIGKAFLVPDIFGGDIVSSHHITTLHLTNSALKPYLAYLSNTLHFHKYAAGCCSGTNILGLNYAGLEQYLMEIPIQRILELFESMVLNTEKRKSKLIIENERLTTMRNQLLPLLMNGQVSVNYDLSYD